MTQQTQQTQQTVTIYGEEWILVSQDENKIYIKRTQEDKAYPASKWVLTPEEIQSVKDAI